MTEHASGQEPAGAGRLLAILSTIGMVVIAVIPAYFTGALAVRIGADFGFGPAALGLAVSWFFVTTSLASTAMGQVVERLGARLGLAVGAMGSSLSMVGLGVASSYPWLLVAMTVGGAANATTQPAVNVVLSQRIASGRLGLAFGIKQAGIPLATLLAGLAIPTVSVLVGWRGTFGIAAAVAATASMITWLQGAREDVVIERPKRRLRDVPEVGPLALLSAGGFLGSAAATSLGVFLVAAAVDGGIEEGSAGWIFGFVSACGLLSRVTLGWYADSHPARSRYGTIALLLLLAVPGYVSLTFGSTPAYLLGAFLAYVVGWAWPGLFHYAVVSQNPVTPAAATGVIQTGLSLGAGLGPLLFGFVAERIGYSTAWLVAAGLSGASAIVLLVGREHLRRTRRTASAAHLDEVLALVWSEGEPRAVAEDVEMQQRTTENLQVTLYRAEPDAVFEPPLPARTGVVFVIAGGEVHLSVAGIETVALQGDYLPLPANRPWCLRNRGRSWVLVAQVEHRGSSRQPG